MSDIVSKKRGPFGPLFFVHVQHCFYSQYSLQIGLFTNPLPPPNVQPIEVMPKEYQSLPPEVKVQCVEPLSMARSLRKLSPRVCAQFLSLLPVARQAASIASLSLGQPSHSAKSAQVSAA